MPAPAALRAVIDTEVRLTRRAIVVCGQLVRVALDERRALLEDGWPPYHSLCEELDKVASRWTGESEHQQRALARLLAEYGASGDLQDASS